ncbi:MAG: hypothetical protein WC426_12380 [Sulfuriferula sp.]
MESAIRTRSFSSTFGGVGMEGLERDLVECAKDPVVSCARLARFAWPALEACLISSIGAITRRTCKDSETVDERWGCALTIDSANSPA